MPLKWSCGSTVFALYHPSKDPNVDKLTSVSYEGWFFWFVYLFFSFTTCFLTTAFHIYPFALSWDVPQCWGLTEHNLDDASRKIAHAVFQTTGELEGDTLARLKRFWFFVLFFFTAPLYLQNIETICRTQCVKLNLSGHLLWGIIYCRWCWDPDLGCLSTYNHHWLSRRAVSEMDKKRKEKVKKTVIIVEIWICLKTLSKMLFVVLFYSSFIAEPRPTFGPKEQYISGVCNYMLLTMCQVYHCMTIRFFIFFVVGLLFFFSQDVSGTDFCGLLVTLRICYMVRRRAVLAD